MMTKTRNTTWDIVPDETHAHWLQLRSPDGWRAHARFDGCVEIVADSVQCIEIHVCELDDFIARLQALRAMAIGYFGEDWPA